MLQYQNEKYRVSKLEPWEIGDNAEVINYEVINQKNDAVEHRCQTLPQAISVADQLQMLLGLALGELKPEDINPDKPKNIVN